MIMLEKLSYLLWRLIVISAEVMGAFVFGSVYWFAYTVDLCCCCGIFG